MIAALINHLWQSTLFCGAIGLVTLALRANAASIRHWMWLLASIKFLVPFSALFFIGSIIGLPAARIASDQPSPLGDALQSVSLLVSPTSALRASPEDGISLAVLALAALWFAGALLVAARWFLAWRDADSIASAAQPDEPLDARITQADIEPAVARVFHPVVLLPAALLGKLSGAQMQAVLAHEREHVERRDNLKDSVHRLTETLFWFHPAVWWIGRHLIDERERACDEAVLEHGHEGAEYAAGILEVCRHCRVLAAVPISATAGNLTQRVRYILGDARPAQIGVVKAVSLLIATVALAVLPMLAGAIHDAARRHMLLTINSRALDSADVSIATAAAGPGAPIRVIADANVVTIRHSTLRDLVALAYGVEPTEVYGGPWLDDQRYDVRAVARHAVADPDELDPHALRAVVIKLLAAHFDLQIHVNSRCESPCGRYALRAPDLTL